MTDPYLVALVNCPAFGSRTLEKLFERWTSAENIWKADRAQFSNLGIPDKRLDAFFTFRERAIPEKYLAIMEHASIRFVTTLSDEYPPLLKTIFDPPFGLFLKGAPLQSPAVSIVGSRKATEYGLKTARTLAHALAQHGISVVSGMAHGVDSAAHEGAFTGGGHTVAVLGGGLLSDLSATHQNTEARILQAGGTIMSEFGLYAPYVSFHFPMRNRIIAGMSAATVITEAGLPSGSMITAKSAIESGRDVFAVPGPIDAPLSAGTNYLIKEGAFICTGIDDILTSLGRASAGHAANLEFSAKPLPPLSPLQAEIYALLERESLYFDDFVSKLNMASSEISIAVVELEILGLVKRLGGERYSRS